MPTYPSFGFTAEALGLAIGLGADTETTGNAATLVVQGLLSNAAAVFTAAASGGPHPTAVAVTHVDATGGNTLNISTGLEIGGGGPGISFAASAAQDSSMSFFTGPALPVPPPPAWLLASVTGTGGPMQPAMTAIGEGTGGPMQGNAADLSLSAAALGQSGQVSIGGSAWVAQDQVSSVIGNAHALVA
jgi:hypothetical protein